MRSVTSWIAAPRTIGAGKATPAARGIWSQRLHTVATTLGRPSRHTPGCVPTSRELEAELGRVVRLTDRGEVWLALAAVSGRLPVDATITTICRCAEFSGASALMAEIVGSTGTDTLGREVRIVADAVVVDVHHTAHTDLATGIQRVARETARRWAEQHDCTLLAWIDHFHALRELTAVETARMLATSSTTTAPAEAAEPDEAQTATTRLPAIVVPWRCTYLLPELVADRERNRRILAMARHTPTTTGVIGFDCIPITSGDTSADRVPDFFADHLATVRHFDRITTISHAAGDEYSGWRTMLDAIGMTGPDIRPILLPAETPASTDEDLDRARRRFIVAGLPMVLCVGTHEPRKNHLAVLHAAEILWQEGVEFSLTFVGGHSWNSEHFAMRLRELQSIGRPLETASGVSDELLWAAYRLARCTVFPSFNEGYGLPAAESLSVGTPVITSGYGSMKEIAADGGALLVDPRNDASIVDALRTLLTDNAVDERLRNEARSRPTRTWDVYAAETWAYLTG